MGEQAHRSCHLSPGDVLGRYRLSRALGAGQMGEVFEATAPDGSVVAIKVLRNVGGVSIGDLRARFEREARLCATLRSPHVVPVLDYDVDGNVPFVVMRRLRGRDLEAWLAQTGPLAPEVACAIALQACSGLQAAHAVGIVHRDFKPANVFLDEADDGTVTAVVCDFGVAKALDEDGALTASGALLGTPIFMAPEQLLDGKRVDARCDVWALGMTLYEALAGRAAFADVRSLADLVVALRALDVPPIQSIAPWLSSALARVVHSALLSREARLPSAAELGAALRSWGNPAARVAVSDLVPAPEAVRSRVATIATLPKHYAELGSSDDRTLALDARASEVDAMIGRTLGGQYRVEKRLGVGGMGAVYEAVDASGRHVAVKMMHAVSGSHGVDAIRRFLREARAVQSIASSHVVTLFDTGVDADTGTPFFVMELLRGSDLSSLMEKHGALEPDVAAALFVQACEGVRSAHAMGLIHRDIKPSNLFVHEEDDGRLVVKVCDFGIAKQLDVGGGGTATELTSTGGLLGSPLYMSPEQAKSAKHVDARSDVYSLALSLHEALSGSRPWGGRTAVGEIIVAVCTEDPPSLEEVAPWCPSDLARAVHRGMARNPSDRFSTVEELARAIRPFAREVPLRRADVVSVSSTARSAAPVGRPPRLTPFDGTDRGLSVSAEARAPAASSRTWPLLLAAASVLLVLGGAGAWFARGRLVVGGTAAAASTFAPPILASPEPPSERSASSTAPASPALASASAAPATVESAASVAPQKAIRRTRPAAGATTVTRPEHASPRERPNASAVPASTNAAKNVGRGNTATDLPD